jgi:uncharacterized protein YbjT (DUF2867 family)
VLITGATGYIGGRLAAELLKEGYTIRCLARSPQKIAGRPWASDPRVEIVQSDLTDFDQVVTALRGCGPAYYLAHSMLTSGKAYAAKDVEMARRFTKAAEKAGITRIIYLGGLGEMGDGLSKHLRSRRETEHALSSSSAFR